MSNLIKYDEGIWGTIKRTFAKIFDKIKSFYKTDNTIQVIKQDENNSNTCNSNVFKEKLKDDSIQRNMIKKDIISQIEEKFDLIYTLPTERLKQISLLYSEAINNKKAEIEALKIKLEKVSFE